MLLSIMNILMRCIFSLSSCSSSLVLVVFRAVDRRVYSLFLYMALSWTNVGAALWRFLSFTTINDNNNNTDNDDDNDDDDEIIIIIIIIIIIMAMITAKLL